jgi:ribosome-associated toxin RatA of RatAB toxin-antitoxin module
MVLHAQATMDIVERPYKEICFTQVDGDFDSFEGRWLLEPLGPGHTMLKYTVETRVRKNSLLPEALVEEVGFRF